MQTGLRALLCLLLPLCNSQLLAEDLHLYNIPLHHALPEQVIPLLQPILAQGSSINGYHQQLILNATAAEFLRITDLLEQLDQTTRTLVISVRGQGQSFERQDRFAIEGNSPGLVDRNQTRVVRADSTRFERQGRNDGTQAIRATEGTAAFISAGTVSLVRQDVNGRSEPVGASNGFYATARLLDNNEVVVDIAQKNDQFAGGEINTQALTTQVRGHVGEWINVSGLNQNQDVSGSRFSSGGTSTTSNTSALSIKVELAE